MSWMAPLESGVVMGLVMALCVLGLSIAFRLFNFPDLTIEGSFLLGAAGFAVALKGGLGLAGAVGCAVLLGAAAGLVTGLLHVGFRMNKFLAGVIVVSICYTAALRLMGSSNIGLLGFSTVFDQLDTAWVVQGISTGKMFFLSALVMAVGAVVLAALTSRFGLRLRVVGCNPDYARTLGIGVAAGMMGALAATNALAAASGALLALHQGFADASLGQGVLIFALASMSIGERMLSERALPVALFILVSALLGSIAYQLVIALAVRAGLNPVDLKLATALLMLALIAFRASRNDDAFAER